MPTHTTAQADFVVIGAGMAGASVAYWLAPHGRVVLLERESQPGYHTTGRSAAVYLEAYGSAQVRALTLASRDFFLRPPASFGDHPLMTQRGAMMVAAPGQEAELQAHAQVLAGLGLRHERLTAAQACQRVPVLRPQRVRAALLEPDACDLDVHAIHQGFLKGMRQHGGQLFCGAEVQSLQHAKGLWTVQTSAGNWQAPVVLNAAGAWAEHIGQMAGAQSIGLVPYRRAAFTFALPADVDASHWPMTYSAGEDWYFKPDAGLLLASPANADPTEPQDVQPEELDIALGIHRIEEATTLTIRRPAHTWAGLRSFVSDKSLVGGFDVQAPGFFWVAGQGGYGIQTSAAMGEACASLARGQPLPQRLVDFGLTTEALSPLRLVGAPSTV
jgi:D-arginine dehydrogenase